MNITIKLTGTRPLIQHNIRLANPLDPHTRGLKELTSQKKKTDEMIARIASAEQRAGYYETEDGLIGLPTENVHASLKGAARTLKLGQQLEKALRCNGEVPALVIDGKETTPEKHMRLEQSLFFRMVRNKNNRVPRARPIIHEWSSTHEFQIDEKLLNMSELKQIAEIAGRDIGVGDWRPRFGTFSAEISNGNGKGAK